MNSALDTPAADDGEAIQRVVKVRRDYNTWVANETVEDYALRFTARSFRKFSEARVANTAYEPACYAVRIGWQIGDSLGALFSRTDQQGGL